MPRPRKNEVKGVGERQQEHRARQKAKGQVRREFKLPQQVVDDEIYIKSREGIERVRQLIGYVFRQQRDRGEAVTLPPLPAGPLLRREFFISDRADDDATWVQEKWGLNHSRALIAWVFRTQRERMELKENGEPPARGAEA